MIYLLFRLRYSLDPYHQRVGLDYPCIPYFMVIHGKLLVCLIGLRLI